MYIMNEGFQNSDIFEKLKIWLKFTNAKIYNVCCGTAQYTDDPIISTYKISYSSKGFFGNVPWWPQYKFYTDGKSITINGSTYPIRVHCFDFSISKVFQNNRKIHQIKFRVRVRILPLAGSMPTPRTIPEFWDLSLFASIV